MSQPCIFCFSFLLRAPTPSPALLPSFSGGVAARSRDGRGARVVVYICLGVAAAFGLSGVMLSLSLPLSLSLVTSSGSRRRSSSTCCYLPWWTSSVAGSFGRSSFNKLAGRIRRTTAAFSFALEATGVVDEERRGEASLKIVDRARADHQWCLRRGYGACAAGQQPALAAPPLILRAERRPDLFLPAYMPIGR